MLEKFTLASLPETEAVARLLAVMSPSDPMLPVLHELRVWCMLRDEERVVCDEKWKAKKEAFAAEWQDYPACFEYDGDTYRKQDACWTLDGGGFMNAPTPVPSETIISAWEKVKPKGATVTVVGGSGG